MQRESNPSPKASDVAGGAACQAKASPDQRFHALYDKVYRGDVLEHAYDCCKANGGAEGVDGQSFADIETYGLGRWLGELAAYRTINSHVRYRFGKWWRAKHKTIRIHGPWHWSRWLERKFGLLELKWDPGRLAHAKA